MPYIIRTSNWEGDNPIATGLLAPNGEPIYRVADRIGFHIVSRSALEQKGDNNMPRELDRCVKKVAAKGKVRNPHAVCRASMGTDKEIKARKAKAKKNKAK